MSRTSWLLPAHGPASSRSKEHKGDRNEERRGCLRLDKVFPVLVESPVFGFTNCIARNISCGGMFLQSRDLFPLGSLIRVYFALSHGEDGIIASGQVKNHYLLNFGSRNGRQFIAGMGVRFTSFEDNGLERLNLGVRQERPLQ